MKEYTELKNKIIDIIEKSNSDKPACKNCKSYCDGVCKSGIVMKETETDIVSIMER